ncbi:MAG: hypothetical protein IKD45_01375 [Clostridia bacterium]|nr:hypothetical protein [Clostridia bacterium]
MRKSTASLKVTATIKAPISPRSHGNGYKSKRPPPPSLPFSKGRGTAFGGGRDNLSINPTKWDFITQ